MGEPSRCPRAARLRVDRLDEIKSLGRGVEPQGGSVPRFERVPDVVRLPLPSTHHRQAANHRADLMMKEAARGRSHLYFIPDPRDVETVQGFYRAIGLALGRAECGEVMTSHKVRCTFSHRVLIKRNGHVPDFALVQGRRRTAIEDPVQVTSADAGETGMPVGGNRVCVEDRDRLFAHECIQAFAQPVGSNVPSDVDMRAHCKRMDARIGPSGSNELARFPGHPVQRFLERLLNGRTMILPLPAHERTSGKLDR